MILVTVSGFNIRNDCSFVNPVINTEVLNCSCIVNTEDEPVVVKFPIIFTLPLIINSCAPTSIAAFLIYLLFIPCWIESKVLDARL